MYRKVMFKRWIPRQYYDTPMGKEVVSGTGCFDDKFKNEGKFHQWGLDFEEFESGPGNYTIAIIENEAGIIEKILPHNVQFISD
jgi:hypothetical protein